MSKTTTPRPCTLSPAAKSVSPGRLPAIGERRPEYAPSTGEAEVVVAKCATADAGLLERHPLEPFLPADARVLMLGSFPPKRIRWSMEFFYPNLQNDMWRIMGYLSTGDKTHFLTPDHRHFDRARIEAFCRAQGIALYDTAVEVIRLKNNASDDSLQVVREVDLAALLAQIPVCHTIVTTGGKATEVLCTMLGCVAPAVGESVETVYTGTVDQGLDTTCSDAAVPGFDTIRVGAVGGGFDPTRVDRRLRLWRMPSSSRAYPRSVEWKAEFYRKALCSFNYKDTQADAASETL